MIQPTLINLHPNEHNQDFCYNTFTVKLDRCAGSCNTLDDLSNKACLPNKTEDLNLSVFNMITGLNESKTLIKHVSYEGKCRFNGKNVIQINFGITIRNVNVSVKNAMYVKKIMSRIPLQVNMKVKNI